MAPERWAQVRHLYETVLAQAEAAVPADLQALCADAFVCEMVTQMLADRKHLPGFLETPLLPVPAFYDDALHDAAGRRIGAYVLERELGRGGMGVVYLAARADEAFQKQVAIKLLWPGLPEDQKRFQRERQILADLDHPGIARLLDGNVTPEGWPYIVMEYVAGMPITEYCDQHWMDCTARIQLLCKVCEAVEYAHEHRVIHRDLKPGNLLVTDDGTPRLLDFGIAKLLDAELPYGLSLSTQTGMRAMTPDYASPEQMRGEEITPASDVYSLGVLLYELLTGQRPFRLEDKPLHEAVRVVSEDDPPRPSASLSVNVEALPPNDPRRLTPDQRSQVREGSVAQLQARLQGDLDNIVLRALSKMPSARYPTVADLRADLERHLRHEPVVAREPTWNYRANRFVRRHRLGVTVTALLMAGLLIALGTALWQARIARREARQANRLLYLREMQQAGLDLADADGNFDRLRTTLDQWRPAAGADDWRGFEWYYLWREAHREQLNLPHPGEVIAVAYAPDGQRLASACADGTVRLWELATGREILQFPAHRRSVKAVAYAPDGQWIASVGDDQSVRVWSATTGQQRWHFDVGGADEFAVAYAATGHRLAVSTNNSLSMFNAETGERLFRVAQEAALVKLAFFPDGRKLVSAGYDQMLKVWDATSGKLLQSVQAHPGSFVFSVAVSPDGRWIASGGNDLVTGGKAARLWEAATLREVKVLAAHTNSVRGVAFAPDGKTLVTVGADRLVMLWDIASGQRGRELHGHTNRLRDVAFSPDGRTVASGGDDNTVKVWNVDPAAEPNNVLTGHKGRIIPAAISPDGKLVATGSADTTAKLWDLASGRERATLQECCGEIYALAFTPDAQTLVTGATDETMKFWSTTTGQRLNTLSTHLMPLAFTPDSKAIRALTHQDRSELREIGTERVWLTLPEGSANVTALRFTADGHRLCTTDEQGSLKVWDVTTQKCLLTMPGDAAGLHFLTLSADGQVAITEGRSQITEAWDTSTGRRLWSLPHAYNAGGAMNVSPDGRWLLAGGPGTVALLRNARTGQVGATLRGHTARVLFGDFSPDGNWIATFSHNWEVKLWDVRTRQVVHTLPTTGEQINCVSFAPDSRTLLTGGGDDVVREWDVPTGSLKQSFRGRASDLLQVCFAPDGTRALSRHVDGWVLVHDVASGQVLTQQIGVGYGGGVQAVNFSPDGQRMVWGAGRSGFVLERATGQPRLELNGHLSALWAASFSPDGQRIVTSAWDNTARVWDAQTGKELAQLRGHQKPVTPSVFSPDGQWIATGGDDGTVKLWNVTTGQLVRTLIGHADAVRGVAFTPDSKRLASTSTDKTVRVWDVETGLELLTLRGHTDEVWAVTFAPDGKTLVSGSWDQTARLWRGATEADITAHRHQP